MKSKIKEKIIEIASYTVITVGILVLAPFVMIALLFWEIASGLINRFGK